MKRLFFPLLLLSVICGALRAQPIDNHAFAQQYMLARVYDETRDLNNAIRIYTDLHKARPEATEVSEGLFRDLYTLKRYPEAEALLLERLGIEHETFDLYLNLAKVRSHLNKKQEALDAFAQAEKATNNIGAYSTAIVIAQAIVEAGYQEEALAFLQRQRKNSDEGEQFTHNIADLLYKLGKYDEGTKEYLSMLQEKEQNLTYIQQSIAQFTADTSLRRTIIHTVTSHINPEKASAAELRLLGWCYGELKNYKGSLEVYTRLENLGLKSGMPSGREMYEFAERIRNEGALDVAVQAYNEAIKRFKEGPSNPQQKSYISMAELGSLKTKEAYFRTLPNLPQDSLGQLVTEYQNFAKAESQNELAFDALLHGGEIAFKLLRDFPTAQALYENIIARSRSYSEKTREAYFALEEIALAQGDIPGALARLDKVNDIISKRNHPEDEETFKRILYERARIDFYNGVFDSSLVKLDSIITDPNSDFANDAIGLHSMITENAGNNAALKLFAKAEFTSLGKDLNAAYSAYHSIPETYPSATIADESVLRAVEILIQLKRANDALGLLSNMQEKMTTSPLLDKAAFREAEIVETILKEKPRAQRMYEDFLARYPKSPLCTEARRRARTLRGDSF